MKKSNLYTRTGDDGTTSLVGGQRVPKTHKRLEAYGTLDELNSNLGLLTTYLTEISDKEYVIQIQNILFDIGSMLATDAEDVERYTQPLPDEDVISLEKAIDETDAIVPHIHSFILPGGCKEAALCHVCRTVCRRAERRMRAVAEDAPIDENALIYVNRLSDFLFALAKKLNFNNQINEIVWHKH